MEQAVLAFIGFALAVPGTIATVIELRKKRSHNRPERAREQRTRALRTPLMLSLAAAGLTSLVAAVMIHFTPPQPSPCAASPHATRVSATLSGSDLDIAVHISCAPPPHYQYVLIREPRDVDVDPTNPHPEYYLTWEMGRPDPGDYQRRINAKNMGGMFTLFIISLDDNRFAQLQAQAQESGRNFVLNLPQSNVVSDREMVKPSS